MVNSKKKLGMGLSSLIDRNNQFNSDNIKEEFANDNKIYKINIKDIFPNQDQPRKYFDEEKIVELADSIKNNGLLQPILVKKENNLYKIIAGERRFRACKYNQMDEISAIILDDNMDDKSLALMSIVENIQREDISFLEEAESYQKLLDIFHYSHDEIANMVGKSRSHITNLIRILTLDKKILKMIEDGKISLSQAKILLTEDNQLMLANKIIKDNLTVKELQAIIDKKKIAKKINNRNLINKEKSKLAKEYKEIVEKSLNNFIDNKNLIINTEFNKDNISGKITIKYKNLIDIENLIKKLENLTNNESN